MEHILFLSYGKDSMACLGAIEKLGWPLDRIVTVDIFAKGNISANLPEMVDFKKHADEVIKEKYGIAVEHYASAYTYDECFYLKRGRTGRKTKFNGKIYGFPMRKGQWCLQQLKLPAMKKCKIHGNEVEYIGIAADEQKRFGTLNNIKISPLVEVGWTENDCMKWCKENNLISPVYEHSARDGCWFCHNQRVEQLRRLRKKYPDLWEMMLQWDIDSPVTFRADGHTVHDFDKRFNLEEKGAVPTGKQFRWSMIRESWRMNIEQIGIDELLNDDKVKADE